MAAPLRGILRSVYGGADPLAPYRERLAAVAALERRLRAARVVALERRAAALRQRVADGAGPEELAIEATALVREAARRTLGQRPFDEQVAAGLALIEGQIVEMATGEGKTLAAVAPVFLRALAGRGAHVLTSNDYLARRDAEWMGPVYGLLGLTVGHVDQAMPAAERRRPHRKRRPETDPRGRFRRRPGGEKRGPHRGRCDPRRAAAGLRRPVRAWRWPPRSAACGCWRSTAAGPST